MGFDPTLGLQDPYSDLLFCLSANFVKYAHEVDETWYSAHKATLVETYSDPTGMYFQDVATSVLGCKWHHQWQWCNPSLPHESQSTPVSSTMDAADSLT